VAAFEQNCLFRNHAALSDMVKQLAVLEHHSVACGTHIISEDFEQLRQVQNKGWAHQSVKRGIQFMQEGLYEKALASYEQALEIDPGNSNAHVARGAAYANKQLLESAIHEFDIALQSEPDHTNAIKYKEATQAKLKAQYKAGEEAKAKQAAAAAAAAALCKEPRVEDKLKLLLKEERKRDKKEKKHRKDKKHKKDKKKKKRKRLSESSSDGE